jgi:hypothetical protein
MADRHKIGWRRLIAKALVLGLLTTLFMVYWPVIVKDLNSSTVKRDLQLEADDAPSYLSDISPPYASASGYKPSQTCKGFFMPTPNFGVDVVKYVYGNYNQYGSLQVQANSDTMPVLWLTRYRFGFPFRSMYFDGYGVGTISGSNPSQKTGFDQIKQRAKFRRGMSYPGWLPCNDGRRLPVSPIWAGLISNLLIWSIFWILLGLLWLTVRTARRKRRGLCLACGYAAEDLERCPECGTKVAGYDFSDA